MYISDLAGYDPEIYDGSQRQLIHKIVIYLATRAEAAPGIDARRVCQAIPVFAAEKAGVVHAWSDQEPPWVHVVDAARRSLLALASPPA